MIQCDYYQPGFEGPALVERIAHVLARVLDLLADLPALGLAKEIVKLFEQNPSPGIAPAATAADPR